nr:MAG TPA: multiple promoter invertase [Caudoviricetes sp.]
MIQELLNANISKRKIAAICKVDRNTLARYIKTFLIET